MIQSMFFQTKKKKTISTTISNLGYYDQFHIQKNLSQYTHQHTPMEKVTPSFSLPIFKKTSIIFIQNNNKNKKVSTFHKERTNKQTIKRDQQVCLFRIGFKKEKRKKEKKRLGL